MGIKSEHLVRGKKEKEQSFEYTWKGEQSVLTFGSSLD